MLLGGTGGLTKQAAGLLTCAGANTYSGVTTISGGSYAEGTDVLQIFANTGGRSGNFLAVNATGLAAGQSAMFNPTTGYITVVPEPTTYAVSAIATLAMVSRRGDQQATLEVVVGLLRSGLWLVIRHVHTRPMP